MNQYLRTHHKTTVIIPTLGLSNSFLHYNIEILGDQNCFIHLVDNSADQICKCFENNRQIRISYFPDNIGVNPAWNYGLQNCQTEHYLLLNDDCLIWRYVIQKCEEIISDGSVGLVSFETISNIRPNDYINFFSNQNQPPRLVLLGPDSSFNIDRIGWFIFGRTDEWISIPPQLKILFGDDFIYRSIRKTGKKTVLDQSNIISHRIRHSLNLVFQPRELKQLYKNEKMVFEQIVTDYQLEGY